MKPLQDAIEKAQSDRRDPASREERSLRLACLSEANATAKLGLAHNVYWTAERYLAWVKGETLVDPNSGLDLIQRLEALTQEFLREERSDPEKIKNDVAEWFSNFELRHPAPLRPDDAASAMTDAIFPPIPPIVHKDIQA